MSKLLLSNGDRFEKLVVMGLSEIKNGHKIYLCKCDCGKIKKIYGSNLINHKSQSCGCLNSERCKDNPIAKRHGMNRTPVHNSWSAMMQRCADINYPDFHHYGGRGITVCERWHKFENFYADMGDRPEGKTLDRIDNNKGYFPDNCRWATQSEQNLNRRLYKHKKNIHET